MCYIVIIGSGIRCRKNELLISELEQMPEVKELRPETYWCHIKKQELEKFDIIIWHPEDHNSIPTYFHDILDNLDSLKKHIEKNRFFVICTKKQKKSILKKINIEKSQIILSLNHEHFAFRLMLDESIKEIREEKKKKEEKCN